MKIKKKILLVLSLSSCIFFSTIPSHVKSEPVTLGIIGTALGGTALGLSTLHWLKDLKNNNNCCCGGMCQAQIPVRANTCCEKPRKVKEVCCEEKSACEMDSCAISSREMPPVMSPNTAYNAQPVLYRRYLPSQTEYYNYSQMPINSQPIQQSFPQQAPQYIIIVE